MENTARVLDITEVEQKGAEVEKRALQIVNTKNKISVTDNVSMEFANTLKLKCKEAIKLIDAEYEPMAQSAFNHHRSITTKWKEKKQPYVDFDAEITTQVKLYLAEIRRQQEAEEARLREIARKEEEEKRLREAAELEAEGRKEEADEILDEPITYVAPVVRMETPKVDNRMYRTQLKVKVQDRMKFLRSVKPETLLELLNEASWTTIESGLSKKAKALGKNFHYDGCTVTEC
jgi:hypothetical protein